MLSNRGKERKGLDFIKNNFLEYCRCYIGRLAKENTVKLGVRTNLGKIYFLRQIIEK